MCVLHLFIYMLWSSRKNEGELVSFSVAGWVIVTLLLLESWCDQHCEVIIFTAYFSSPVTQKAILRKHGWRHATIRERTATKVMFFTKFIASTPFHTSWHWAPTLTSDTLKLCYHKELYFAMIRWVLVLTPRWSCRLYHAKTSACK